MSALFSVRGTVLSAAFAVAGCSHTPSAKQENPSMPAQKNNPEVDDILLRARLETAAVVDIVCGDTADAVREPLLRGDVDVFTALHMLPRADHSVSISGMEPARPLRSDGRFCVVTPLSITYESYFGSYFGQSEIHKVSLADYVAVQCDLDPVQTFKGPIIVTGGLGLEKTQGTEVPPKAFIMAPEETGTKAISFLEPDRSCKVAAGLKNRPPHM